jgi:hypothetical protein
MKITLLNFQIAIVLLWCQGCLDQEAGSYSTCSIQYTQIEFSCGGGAEGVSLLLAVDTSSSMADKQNLVSKSVYSLVNTLTTMNPDNFGYVASAISDIRVAVISSDLGLAFGEDHASGGTNQSLHCVDEDGDMGKFKITSGTGKTCLDDGGEWATSDLYTEDGRIADQTMCMASQAANGCEIEQTLESALIAMEGHPDFIHGTHSERVFALIIISDEDDSSIADDALFETASWKESPNIAGGYPIGNGDYLFPTSRYLERFKDAAASWYPMFFGAVVGVPPTDTCQGDGDRLLKNGCLDLAEMQPASSNSSGDIDGFTALDPACAWTDPQNGNAVSATPGRRYVELAEEFGANGYIASLCNDDMETVMKTMASHIWFNTSPMCWPDMRLRDKTKPYTDMADCMHTVTYHKSIDEDESCPAEFYAGFSEQERLRYESMKTVTPIQDWDGNFTQKSIRCILPKLPLPLDCKEAAAEFQENYSDYSGWYYCENHVENTAGLCDDGLDDDGDGFTDCDDDECAVCDVCGGETECPLSPTCSAVTQGRMTAAALRAAEGGEVDTYCRYHPIDEEDCALK